MSLGLVIGIHVVLISALIIGLSSDQIGKTFVEITATMIPKKAQVQDLPPPPVAAVKSQPRPWCPAADIRYRGRAAAVIAATQPVALRRRAHRGNRAHAYDAALSAAVTAHGRAGHDRAHLRDRCRWQAHKLFGYQSSGRSGLTMPRLPT